MNFEEIQRRSRELFRAEAADLLVELEKALLELEQDPGSLPVLNRAFRALHTLKGSGGTAGYQDLADFLHRVEDVFNAAREGRLTVTSAMVDHSLQLADAVAGYIVAPPAEAARHLQDAAGTLQALLACVPAANGEGSPGIPLPGSDHAGSPLSGGTPPSQTHRFRIQFKPHPNLFLTGGDPGIYLDDLRALGSATIQAFTDGLPPLEQLDPDESRLRWEITLETTRDENVVRDVFLFVEGECDLTIERVHGALISLDDPAPASVPAGSAATSPGSPGTPPGSPGTPFPGNATPPAPLRPSTTRSTNPTPPNATPGTRKPTAKAGASDVLKVSAERMDRLVNLVGQLVILRSQVKTACANAEHLPDGLQGAAEALQTLSTEMRDVVLNIRMMPIEQTFAKFQRLVRDLARELGKDIGLVVEGGETEMDKAVLDALADPLVHLVRNSIDHGLEPAAERLAAGKPAQGTLTLRAEQRGDRVLVVVRDDGRGLDPARIRDKAVARGLLSPTATPSEAELFELIFLPGFSTAETVSQVSGRGVGLDVVRRQVDQLRGRVEVRSQLGRGVEFRLSLPLTLAIIDGLMVEVGGDRYILPLGIAREAIDLKRAIRDAGNGRNLVQVRGEAVPYVRLRSIFGCTGPAPESERVVLVDVEERRLGLVVDRVIGNHQTVIKSLGWISGRVHVFSGATVLGDGRIALIIDVAAVLNHHRESGTTSLGLEI